jgi:hypothetical protein
MSHAAAKSLMDKINTDIALREANASLAGASREARSASAVKVGAQQGLSFTEQEYSEVEAVKEFWKKASHDGSRQEKLTAAAKTQDRGQLTQRVAEVARGAGYSFPVSILDEITSPAIDLLTAGSGALEEKELEAVVGGATLATSSLSTSTIQFSSLASPLDAARLSTGAVASTVMCPW